MGKINSAILVGLTIALCLGLAQCTKCYVCSSASNDGCGEDDFSVFTSKFSIESDCDYCTKVVGTLGGSAVTRGCVSSCSEVDATLFGQGVKTKCCSSLLCNGSAETKAPIIFIVTLMAAIFILL